MSNTRARAILGARSKSSRILTFGRWFSAHRTARVFVAEWVAMRAKGETDWSVARVLRHLIEKMDCPLRSQVAFQRWLQENHPTEYRRFISR